MKGLTAKEGEIVRLLALDLGVKEIADRLGVSAKTVEWHLNGTENRRSVYAVLGVRSKAAAARWAVENGLVKPGEKMEDKMMEQPRQEEPKVETSGDLARVLMRAAAQAAAGKANPLQVNALCQCTQALIGLTRMTLEAQGKVGWMEAPRIPKKRD